MVKLLSVGVLMALFLAPTWAVEYEEHDGMRITVMAI